MLTFFLPMCTVTDFSDVFFDPVETDNQAEEKTLRVNEGRPISSQEASNASALNGKAALTEGKSMFQRPLDAVNMQEGHDE